MKAALDLDDNFKSVTTTDIPRKPVSSRELGLPLKQAI